MTVLSNNVLVEVYKQKVADLIYADLLKDMEPRLRKAARDAVDALDAHVREYVSDRGRAYIVEIEARIDGEKVKR